MSIFIGFQADFYVFTSSYLQIFGKRDLILSVYRIILSDLLLFVYSIDIIGIKCNFVFIRFI